MESSSQSGGRLPSHQERQCPQTLARRKPRPDSPPSTATFPCGSVWRWWPGWGSAGQCPSSPIGDRIKVDTVSVLFALQGEQITDRPLDVARVAVPLLIYFGVMCSHHSSPVSAWVSPTTAMRQSPLPQPATTSNWPSRWPSQWFGVTSGQALAGTIGPLIEVPVLVALDTRAQP